MSNAPVRPSIEIDADGTIVTVFYREDGCICAMAAVFPNGSAFAHILDGATTIAKEKMSAEEIAEAVRIAADAP